MEKGEFFPQLKELTTKETKHAYVYVYIIIYIYIYAPPKTNSSPLKISLHKRKCQSSNHQLSGAKMLVSGRGSLIVTPLNFNIAPEKMMVGRSWKTTFLSKICKFSGALLNFQEVIMLDNRALFHMAKRPSTSLSVDVFLVLLFKEHFQVAAAFFHRCSDQNDPFGVLKNVQNLSSNQAIVITM